MAIDATTVTTAEENLTSAVAMEKYVIDGQVVERDIEKTIKAIDWMENRIAKKSGIKPRVSSFKSGEY